MWPNSLQYKEVTFTQCSPSVYDLALKIFVIFRLFTLERRIAKRYHHSKVSSNSLDGISAHGYVSHPINAFALMKRMSVDWREIIRGDGDLMKKLPVERDFVYGAHFGLMAAQNYYDQVRVTNAEVTKFG